MDKIDTIEFSWRSAPSRAPQGAPPAMSRETSPHMHACPVAAFQRMISGKYKLRIVWDLKDGPLRYGEIRSDVPRCHVASTQ
jgi:hypothetical protein